MRITTLAYENGQLTGDPDGPTITLNTGETITIAKRTLTGPGTWHIIKGQLTKGGHMRRIINDPNPDGTIDWTVIADDGPPNYGAHTSGTAPDVTTARQQAQTFIDALKTTAPLLAAQAPKPAARKTTARKTTAKAAKSTKR